MYGSMPSWGKKIKSIGGEEDGSTDKRKGKKNMGVE